MTMDKDNDRSINVEYTGDVEAGRKGGVVAAHPGPTYATRPALTESEIGEAAYLGISRATWSSIWAGFFVGAITNIVLAMLGIALGISWVSDDPVSPGAFRTAAGIWMVLTSLVSFFVGGFVTSRMGQLPGRGTGAMNGFLYGCFAWVLLMVLTVTPLINMLPSFASLFTNMGGTPNLGLNQMPNVRIDQAQAAAWWSFFGLLVSLGAATIGGLVGARDADVDPLRTGAEHPHREPG